MVDAKTPEQAARDFAKPYESDDDLEYAHYTGILRGFLAGRQHFIENELRGLLELAREGVIETLPYEDSEFVFRYSIDEILAKARGEE